MAHRLHVVMSVNNKRLWTTTTLAIDDWISGADAERARSHAHALHRLFDRLGNRAHACTARGHGRHAAKILQPFRKTACVPIDVAVKLGKGHYRTHSMQPLSSLW